MSRTTIVSARAKQARCRTPPKPPRPPAQGPHVLGPVVVRHHRRPAIRYFQGVAGRPPVPNTRHRGWDASFRGVIAVAAAGHDGAGGDGAGGGGDGPSPVDVGSATISHAPRAGSHRPRRGDRPFGRATVPSGRTSRPAAVECANGRPCSTTVSRRGAAGGRGDRRRFRWGGCAGTSLEGNAAVVAGSEPAGSDSARGNTWY